MNQQLPTDKERAEVIIAPQAYAGIEETEEQARQGRAENPPANISAEIKAIDPRRGGAVLHLGQ